MMVGTDFLAATLGQQGVDALQKAADVLPELAAIIVPRACIAYLETAQRISYEGEIPGTEAYMEKGELVIDDVHYDMGTDFLAAASALTLAVAGDIQIPATLDPRRVARLCKGVAALAKAKFLARIRVLEDSARGSPDSSASGSVSVSNGKVSISISETEAAAEDSASGLEKDIGMPGKAAPPGAPKLPTPPIAQKKAPGIGGKPNTKLTRSEVFQKSELMKACKTCGQTQLRGRQMVGCLCCCDVVLGEGVVVKAEDQRYTVIGPDADVTIIEDSIRR